MARIEAPIIILGAMERHPSLFGRVNPVITAHNHHGERI
jgi:hypothetical protein